MKKNIAIIIIILLLFAVPVEIQAGNPVIKDRYSADPAALVHDGKVYLYTGHDEATVNDHFFVLKEWSIYSSEDMINWSYEGSLDRKTFTWGMHDTAWASQAIERDGKFYWYTTVRNNSHADPGYAIGVAVSDHPVEGFTDALGEPLITSSMTETPEHMGNDPWDVIDPTIFIDEDGQAHMYFGNTHLYYVKLKDNMIELDGEIELVEIQNMRGTFTEGPFLHYDNDQYYLTFAINYPEEIGYATSDSPDGPWEFQGKIMDRIPNSGTSHPAVLEFEDQSYFIYHNTALAGGGENNRSVAIERLHYYEDGSIAKIIPTASGVKSDSYLIRPINSNLALRQVTMALRVDEINEEHFDYRWHETESLASLGDDYVSYQIDNNPGVYLVMTEEGQLKLEKNDGSSEFSERASFRKSTGLADQDAYSLQPYLNEHLYVATINEGSSVSLVDASQLESEAAATFTIEQAAPIIPPNPNEANDTTEPKESEEPLEQEVEEDKTEEVNDQLDQTKTETSNQLTWMTIILVSLIVAAGISYYLLRKRK
ncbi:family 43 glycosylhydrolase [Amphibacillus indicireducens]|uniref:Alpha-L-arabinofuranosidase B arabinose-binding domain-containing protein n=1 Tax=Amphibacillus indicireducens TaxID=1076330 RepID=A0ABP7V8Q0_9BACI